MTSFHDDSSPEKNFRIISRIFGPLQKFFQSNQPQFEGNVAIRKFPLDLVTRHSEALPSHVQKGDDVTSGGALPVRATVPAETHVLLNMCS